jgi:hypothetical protein
LTLRLTLEPYESCGPLKRGLQAHVVEQELGHQVEKFRKTPLASHPTLDVGPGLLHVGFDGAGGCNGVELFPETGASLKLSGEELLLDDGKALVASLVRFGQHWEVDIYGIHVPMLGIATFHHDFDWNGGKTGIETLFVSLDPDFVP